MKESCPMASENVRQCTKIIKILLSRYLSGYWRNNNYYCYIICFGLKYKRQTTFCYLLVERII